MYKIKENIKTKKTKEEIWGLYENPAINWIKWDDSLKEVIYEHEELKTNENMILILNNNKKIEAKITSVNKYTSFSDISENKVFLIKFNHHLEEVKGEILITHSVEVEAKIKIFKILEAKICKTIAKDFKNSLIKLGKDE